MEASIIVIEVPRDLWPRRGDWRGKVVSILKGVGDRVEPGEPVAEVEIEKAILVVESPVRGVVREVLAGPGSVIGPGSPLLRVEPVE